MIEILRILWFKFFFIDQEKAIQIAAKSSPPDIRQYQAFETPPRNMNIYNLPQEPCWYVTAPWGDDLDGRALGSGRIIIISKKTGRVLYDGSANDEG